MKGCILYVLLIEKSDKMAGVSFLVTLLITHFHFSSFCCLCLYLRRAVSTILSVRKSCIPEAFDSPSCPVIKGEAVKVIALTSAAVPGPCQTGQAGPTAYVTLSSLQPVVLPMVEVTFGRLYVAQPEHRLGRPGHRGDSCGVLIRWQPHDSCPTSELLVAMQMWLVMRSCCPLLSDGARA